MLAATVLWDPLDKKGSEKGKLVARRGRKVTGFEKRRPGCHYTSRSFCVPCSCAMPKKDLDRHENE
jgi:hypothetical protein